MTPSAPTWRERIGPKTMLAVLAAFLFIVAFLIPETPMSAGGAPTTYSAQPGGARIAFELATRMGWRTTRRLSPLDSTTGPSSVQVVLQPEMDLGAAEVHRLLENVRHGGGLIFTLDGGEEISDSLGLAIGEPSRFIGFSPDTSCPPGTTTLPDRLFFSFPSVVRKIGWRRPRPGPVIELSERRRGDTTAPAAIGFPLERGRVAVVTTSKFFTNDVIRVCGSGADVVVARTFEYMRPDSEKSRVLAFDEFHHGFGIHGGSIRAVSRYLGGTSSGHFLMQALLAGLILLLALAPRPIAPRDPERTSRRSPLEHADALGQAYSEVGATRTATARLVSGLRRRAGRMVPISPGVEDSMFLDAVARTYPSIAAEATVVRDALTRSISPRDLLAVGVAVQDIERHLMTPLSHRS